MSKIGLYLHVPFCEKKCPYCDFYSIHASEEWLNLYTDCMIKRMQYNSFKLGRLADTLYFGGGTPSLLRGTRIARLIGCGDNRRGQSRYRPGRFFTGLSGRGGQSPIDRDAVGG